MISPTTKSTNPFHRIEPHRNLPVQIRRVLWAACELVLENPRSYADAANWLEHTFSETATRERELARSEEIWRLDLQHSADEQQAQLRRADRDTQINGLSGDRGWRLAQAMRELLSERPAIDDEDHARHIVLLACLLSYHRELPLSGEFCNWTWESAGTDFAAWLDRELSATYVAGRSTVLFGSGTDQPAPDWLDPFALLTKRALRFLETP